MQSRKDNNSYIKDVWHNMHHGIIYMIHTADILTVSF